MRLDRAVWIIGFWAALAAGGCIVEVDFDPIGSDASVEGAWTIDGAAPSQASCDALGISNVRVRFYDGGLTVDPASLVFSCADGSFDTRPSTVLADGRYTMEMLAIDATGTVIAEGGRETFDTLVEGGHIQMTTVNFIPAVAATSVTASWTIDGAAPDATNCAALGIATVGLEFMDGSAPSTIACETGSIAVDLTAGSYSVEVIGYDSAGEVVAMAMAEAFAVNEGETHALNGGAPIPFVMEGFNPLGTDVSLDMSWTIGGITNTPSAEVCEVAGGTTIEVVLYETTDTARAEGVTVAMAPCADGDFESTGNIIRAGTYLVTLFYRDAAMVEVGRREYTSEDPLVAGDTLDLTGADVRLVNTTLSFAIGWQPKGAIDGVYADCSDANAPLEIFWDLGRGDTGATDPGDFTQLYAAPTMMEACEDRLTFSAATSEPVTPGVYDLLIEGFETTKAWGLADPCRIEIAAEGDLAMIGSTESCKLDYIAGS
ncbi:MAG: hypothetical protein AB8I08_17910 [Sandaracinaceae bacterium]